MGCGEMRMADSQTDNRDGDGARRVWGEYCCGILKIKRGIETYCVFKGCGGRYCTNFFMGRVLRCGWGNGIADIEKSQG